MLIIDAESPLPIFCFYMDHWWASCTGIINFVRNNTWVCCSASTSYFNLSSDALFYWNAVINQWSMLNTAPNFVRNRASLLTFYRSLNSTVAVLYSICKRWRKGAFLFLSGWFGWPNCGRLGFRLLTWLAFTPVKFSFVILGFNLRQRLLFWSSVSNLLMPHLVLLIITS